MPNKTIRNKKLGSKKNKSRRIKRGGVRPSLTELAKVREERERQRQRQPTLTLRLQPRQSANDASAAQVTQPAAPVTQPAASVTQPAAQVTQPAAPDTSMDTEIAARLQAEEDGRSSSAASSTATAPDISKDAELAARLQAEEAETSSSAASSTVTARATDTRPSTPVRTLVRESGGGGEAPPARSKRTSSGTRTTTEPASADAATAQPGFVVPQSFLAYGQVETPFMAAFPMSDSQLDGFKRHVHNSSDCVINAMQLLGLIDERTGDLMRITAMPLSGFHQQQIEKLMERTTSYKYDFRSSSSYQEFLTAITQLEASRAIFCGIKRSNGTSHAFIIGRGVNGTLYFIDPQIPIICDITDPACSIHIRENVTEWFILFRSDKELSGVQLEQAGFLNTR
jgi:hypothetical protein